ncbi:tetratricopeptide repeat protein [Polynucleobacter sp. es-MAR-4]|uniref:tetratricopeptide repeat protein n=1 Tax=Polynucleobacter sp. es-MAR-4 TaxID=1855655 RepID=UPI001C0CD0EF|nr:tetratricopeptide repeat protein [Polynucleobacter sp. es-MAR-4]MBU3636999.1 tetratricopeptide repeat protein [Polynucleobacter sp. es-MAR-4]
MNPQIGFLLHKSIESLENSNLVSAELYLKQALKLEAKNPHVLGLLGIVSAKKGLYPEALKYTNDSLKALPKNPITLSNLGNIYLELKEFEKALDAYDKSIKIEPKYAEAWSNKGNVLQELKRFEEAITHYDQAITLTPNSAEAWSNKGNALQEVKRFEEALTHYDQALQLRPNYAEAWSNKGNALQEVKRFEEAIAHYDQALGLKPEYVKAYASKGNTLQKMKRFEEAIAYYDHALSLDSAFAEAYSCKGYALHDLKQFDEAITQHDKALALNSDRAESWLNKGLTLNALARYDEAITCCQKALSLVPDLDWVDGYLIHLRMKIASWSGFAGILENIFIKILANKKAIRPFDLLSLNDDPVLNRQAANIFAKNQFLSNLDLEPIPKHGKNEKIRIAYFSPDFRNHPVSFLTAELFEIHDRSRFEVVAFALQKAPVGDEMNLRLKQGFDKFIEVDNLSDQEIAGLARDLGIDIAIDLAGFTQNSRVGIFSYRAAPIQVNWLGYPGTIGADFIDYIVADRAIIPESHRDFYAEKIVHLPDTYMVDDSMRLPSSRVFTREECGLPEDAFIFCCFNNDFKFNPHVLDVWSRILLTVENSVLWISKNNKDFQENIKAEFEKCHIASSRIIFAQRVDSMADYLARYRLADLFLDTYPYGAHTTAVDSLKAGVPLLTLMGQSFPSRVAASLLNAIGLPELITTNEEEYAALAIELATKPEKLADIKLKLASNLLTAPLFDTPLFTKNLEAVYLRMYERYQLDLPPDHISIGA